MARLARVRLQNSRARLTPVVSIRLPGSKVTGTGSVAAAPELLRRSGSASDICYNYTCVHVWPR